MKTTHFVAVWQIWNLILKKSYFLSVTVTTGLTTLLWWCGCHTATTVWRFLPHRHKSVAKCLKKIQRAQNHVSCGRMREGEKLSRGCRRGAVACGVVALWRKLPHRHNSVAISATPPQICGEMFKKNSKGPKSCVVWQNEGRREVEWRLSTWGCGLWRCGVVAKVESYKM